MSRRIAALKPQLNRIRAWAHEGSTDAWIAHQLETTAESVRAFRQEHGIERGGPAPLAPITPDSVVEAMLAEEAAALEAGPEPEAAAHVADEAESEPAPARTPRRRTRKPPAEETASEAPADAAEPSPESSADEPAEEPADAPAASTRRRGARGGAGRGKAKATADPEAAAEPDADDEPAAEGESDDLHGELTGADEPTRGPRKRGRRRGRGRGNRGLEARLLAGSVLLLDPSVTVDATFQEHWQGGGPLRVEVSPETIVLRRAPSGDADHERSHNA